MKKDFDTLGYTTIDHFYTPHEISAIVHCISLAQNQSENFRRSTDLFAIRQFLKEIPAVKDLVFTPAFKTFIAEHFGENYFVVKSIYFDKPEQSNWFVAWHQDLTISVDQKTEQEGYGPWTVKNNQFAVQPPVELLENILTIRIHLDDTDENNGALKVIPGSHLNGIVRTTEKNMDETKAVSCKVKQGGIMLMKPLLFHSSGRTTNGEKRRVIHLEFSNLQVPSPMKWSEQNVFQ